jgi:hypothetical protein
LRRILVADGRIELGQCILCNCFAWGSTLRTFFREHPWVTSSSFAYRLHVVD